MNKKMFFLLSLIFVFNLGFADIYQASKWINEEGKMIYVYHACHALHSNESQLDHLYNDVFTKFQKNKPGRKLLVLSECTPATWAGKEIRKLSSPEILNHSNNTFLQQFRKMFNRRIKRYLKKLNVDIVNIENRISLEALEYCILRQEYSESSNLMNFFSNKTFKEILYTIYSYLFEHIENSTNEQIQTICSLAIENFEKESQSLVNSLINIGIPEEIVTTRPFLEIGHRLMRRGPEHQRKKFTMLIRSLLENTFFEIIETNALIHILLSESNQDVAIFIGGSHAIEVEKYLPSLGYELIEKVNTHYIINTETPVPTTKLLINIQEFCNHSANNEILAVKLVSNDVFNWILE